MIWVWLCVCVVSFRFCGLCIWWFLLVWSFLLSLLIFGYFSVTVIWVFRGFGVGFGIVFLRVGLLILIWVLGLFWFLIVVVVFGFDCFLGFCVIWFCCFAVVDLLLLLWVWCIASVPCFVGLH